MIDECDEIEDTVRRAMQSENPWSQLSLESQRTTDTWYFWSFAFDTALDNRHFLLVNQIMTEQLQHHEDFSAQPNYMAGYALALEHFEKNEEALRAIRSAIQDDPYDVNFEQIERRLIEKLRR